LPTVTPPPLIRFPLISLTLTPPPLIQSPPIPPPLIQSRR
jgi:hypothetical protein